MQKKNHVCGWDVPWSCVSQSGGRWGPTSALDFSLLLSILDFLSFLLHSLKSFNQKKQRWTKIRNVVGSKNCKRNHFTRIGNNEITTTTSVGFAFS